MASVTLADFALTVQDKVLKGFVMSMVRESPILGAIPFITMDVLSVLNKKWSTLPAGQTRLLNEGYSTAKGTTVDETYEVSIYGKTCAMPLAV